MKILGYAFKPSWFSIFISLLGIVIFSSLGTWQLQRAEYKKSLLAEMEMQGEQQNIDLNTEEVDEEKVIYRKLSVKGQFIRKGVVYTDNEMHEGEVGFHVYVPFKLSGSDKWLLVNLGWTPYAGSRENLPEIELNWDDHQTIVGLARVPSKRPVLPSSAEPLDLNTDNLWLYMDLDKYRDEFDNDLFPFALFMIESDSESAYVRSWPAFNPKTGMHIGYALQWFGLALITLCLFLYVGLKKTHQEN